MMEGRGSCGVITRTLSSRSVRLLKVKDSLLCCFLISTTALTRDKVTAVNRGHSVASHKDGPGC